ncbi:penicillin-binding transpeptidase domain-containing protein [Shouchella shacheensis]|uniref:penicillin-binding transpeptidase domain-containing protein n=1 Tax=Shouchella shacheensis TaxID=1649580 RepID=UPI0007404EBB|nr:penicillin-binding transpeptidase domain-containing protein [Shouchella shacheensis]
MKRAKKARYIASFSGIALALAACSAETPEEPLNAYLENWESQDFAAMYGALSPEVQAEIDEDAFVERHETIYDAAQVEELALEATLPEEFDGEDEEMIPVSVSMDTIAGEVAFEESLPMVRSEEDEWRVDWKPQLIFPQLEEGDSVRVTTSAPERGEILDVNGEALAENGRVLEVGFVPGEMEDEEEAIEAFAEETGLTEESIRGQLEQDWVQPEHFVAMHTVSTSEMDWADELNEEIPGASYQEVDGRVYPVGEAAAHLVGYIRPINAEQLEELADEGYSQGDVLGQTGLEAVLEERLRGEGGAEIFTTGEEGERKETVAETEPVDGEDVHLTIDAGLQEDMYNELDEEPGTGVAMNPLTGETLALVSAPAYDPNQVSLGLSAEEREELEDDEGAPFLNRFSSRYSPGSTIKAMTAAYGLETGTIDPADTLDVDGLGWQPEGSDWGDYEVRRVSDHGSPVDLERALVYSDNIYFARAALDMGEEVMEEQSERFGFGESLPYTYPVPASQLTGEDGFSSEIQLADTGYGQGAMLVSPVHLTTMYTSLVNEGNIITPVLEQEEETGETWLEAMSAEHASLIDDALTQTVEDQLGTASAMQQGGLSVAAKTGTAELSDTQGEEGGAELGWIVAYNNEEPELLMTLMSENVEDHGGSGYVVEKMDRLFADHFSD